MKRLFLYGFGVAVVVLSNAGGAARAGSSPRSLVAVVREGTGVGCVDTGPGGSQALFQVFSLPVISCPAAICEGAPVASPPSGKHHAPAPSCPKPRPSGIYLVGPDGLDPHWLAAGVEPAWSADGTELAYSTGRFLAIQGVDGDPPRDVIVALPTVLAESGVIGGPSWSPDGRQIVFSFFHTDTSVAGDEWREDLYTVDVATVDVRLLTATLAGETDHSPAFSPDGTKIAYAHWGSQPGIWVMNADGSDAHSIASVAGYPLGVSWSPDGRSLVFALRTQAYTTSEIDVVGADGSNLHRVATTDDTVILDRPAWSPDGQQVEFTANAPSGHTRALYAVRPDGTDSHVVLTEPWAVFQPVWRPAQSDQQ